MTPSSVICVETINRPMESPARRSWSADRYPVAASPKRHLALVAGSRSRVRAGLASVSADPLGEPDEDALGASDVAEPIDVLVLDDLVDELGTMLSEPGERVAEVVDGEHDAEIAERVHGGRSVIGDHGRR